MITLLQRADQTADETAVCETGVIANVVCGANPSASAKKREIRKLVVCVSLFLSFTHKIAVISQTKNTALKPCLFLIWEVRQKFFYFLAVLAFFLYIIYREVRSEILSTVIAR